MKKFSIFLPVFLFATSYVSSKERMRVELDSIANSVFNIGCSSARLLPNGTKSMNLVMDSACSKELNRKIKSNDDIFMVYTFPSDRPGYVIVSKDDRLPAVMAFSENKKFDIFNMSTALRFFLKHYIERKVEGEEPEIRTRTDIEQTEVTPLLGDIAFSQFSPYNDKCPVQDGEHTVTGCLATAMAQILAYYKYPSQMFGDKIEYVAPKYNISVYWDCTKTIFDWKNILDTYDSETVLEYTDNEIITDREFMSFTDMKLSDGNVIDITSLINICSETLNGDMQLLLCDDNGNLIQPIGQKCNITSLKPGYGWGTAYIKHTISGDIPDGNYRLYLGLKLKETNEWSLIQQSIKDISQIEYQKFFLNLSKNGKYYTINGRIFLCSYTKAQGEAIATLLAACGAATQMNYGTDGSSTNNNNIGKGFIDYMGYDDGLYFVDSNISPRKEWNEELLEQELQAKRPIYCCGSLEENGGSHSFVIDGYKYYGANPYFHINWGWNGQNNGYFLLDAMTTTSGQNYGYAYSVTLGIKPDDGLDDGFVFTIRDISATVSDGIIVLTIEDFVNRSCKTFSGEIIIYATDQYQKEYLLTKYSWESWKEFTGYGSWNKDIAIPNELDNGEYIIKIKVKGDNSVIEREVLTHSFPSVRIERDLSGIKDIQLKEKNASSVLFDLSGRKVTSVRKNHVGIANGEKYILK